MTLVCSHSVRLAPRDLSRRRALLATMLAAPLVAAACGGGSRGPGSSEPDVMRGEAVRIDQPPAPAEAEISGPVPAKPESGSTTESLADCIRAIRRDAGDSEDADAYREALGAEENGERELARERYLGLVQQYPKSVYVPLAYLAFGEMFAAEIDENPNVAPTARAVYEKVLQYPPDDRGIWVVAAVRVAEMRAREGNPQRVLADVSKAMGGLRTTKGACDEKLEARASRLLVGAYVEVGRPEKATAYFHRLAGDGSRRSDRALDWLAKLAAEYRKRDQIDVAEDVTMSAIQLGTTPALCDEATRYPALASLKSDRCDR